jgi:hypothetical protein
MRNQLLLLLSGAYCGVFGQSSFEMTDHRAAIVHHTAVAATGPGQCVFAGWVQDADEARAFVERRDNMGILMASPITVQGVMTVPQWVMATDDGGFVVIGESHTCSLPVYKAGIMRIDATGQPTHQLGHATLQPTAMARSSFGIAVGGHDVDAPSQGRLWVVDEAGDTTIDLPLTEGPVQNLVWTTTGRLLLLFTDRVSQCDGSTGDELSHHTLPAGALDLAVLSDGTIAILYTDHLLLLNGSFTVIGTLGWNASSARWMEYTGAQLWITCEADVVGVDPFTATVSVFDQTFGPVNVHSSAMAQDVMLFAGSRPVLDRSSGVLMGRGVNSAPAEPLTDVAISVHHTDSLHFHVDTPFPQIVTVRVQHTLEITNTGTTPITSVRINSQRTLPFCGADHRVDTLLSFLSLPPGGSVLVRMPPLTSWPIHVPVGGDALFSPCYVALSPSARVDAVPENDHTCVDIPVTIPIGMEERGGMTGPTLHPSLVDEHFTLYRTTTSEATVVLRDGIGRELTGYSWPTGSERLTVDASTLQQGLVLVHYRDGSHERVLRAVKR